MRLLSGGDQALTRISDQIHNYYQLSFEPPSTPAVIFLLTMAALRACLLPARRAASVEPMRVLRMD
jgi:ABC-type lipoprotein release transport system permease subunit